MNVTESLANNTVTLDLQAAIANIKRQGEPKRVFRFEHGLEDGIKEALCRRFDLCAGLDKSAADFALGREIRLHEFLGIEFMRVFPGGIVWPGLEIKQGFIPPPVGPIQSWEDFETYAWPRIEQVDFSSVEWFEHNLAENMALWAMVSLFQQVVYLIGFEPLCIMLYDDRGLVKAVTEKVGEFFLKYTEALGQFSRVGAINVGDDMGHKTGTLINPNDLREIFIPWQKQVIDLAHACGKLGLFHTCGQVEAIMEDLIEQVGIDAKHSTQDVIEPIIISKQRWGGRVGLLGGVDVDFITRRTPEQVRGYTRRILETCTSGGGFALGVGNWVADSIPLENYLAMLDEGRRYSL